MYNILEHKQAIAENIQKAFGDTPEDIEKAKWQIGEIRTDSRGIAHECYEYTAEGKPRLRRVKKNKGASTTSTDNKTTQSKTSTNSEVDNFMKLVQKFSDKYTDENKVTVTKTPKGNWEVSYNGSRLGIINADQLSEKTAKAKGWLKEDKKEEPTKLSECVKGDTVALIYKRFNPQLSGGGYAKITKHTIERVNKATFEVDGKKFYKDSGTIKNSVNDVYGSSDYKIVLPSEVSKLVKNGEINGFRINKNDFED